MSYSVAPLERLIEQLERLPGIGHKSAQRLAFFLLNQPEKNAADFVTAITEAREKIHECAVCRNLTDQDLCPICRAGNRDASVICVVEDPRDVMAFERTREYAACITCCTAPSPLWTAWARIKSGSRNCMVRVADEEVQEVIMATIPRWREKRRPCISPSCSSLSRSR